MCAGPANWVQDAKEHELCESWDSSGNPGILWKRRVK